MARSGFAEVF